MPKKDPTSIFKKFSKKPKKFVATVEAAKFVEHPSYFEEGHFNLISDVPLTNRVTEDSAENSTEKTPKADTLPAQSEKQESNGLLESTSQLWHRLLEQQKWSSDCDIQFITTYFDPLSAQDKHTSDQQQSKSVNQVDETKSGNDVLSQPGNSSDAESQLPTKNTPEDPQNNRTTSFENGNWKAVDLSNLFSQKLPVQFVESIVFIPHCDEEQEFHKGSQSKFPNPSLPYKEPASSLTAYILEHNVVSDGGETQIVLNFFDPKHLIDPTSKETIEAPNKKRPVDLDRIANISDLWPILLEKSQPTLSDDVTLIAPGICVSESDLHSNPLPSDREAQTTKNESNTDVCASFTDQANGTTKGTCTPGSSLMNSSSNDFGTIDSEKGNKPKAPQLYDKIKSASVLCSQLIEHSNPDPSEICHYVPECTSTNTREQTCDDAPQTSSHTKLSTKELKDSMDVSFIWVSLHEKAGQDDIKLLPDDYSLTCDVETDSKPAEKTSALQDDKTLQKPASELCSILIGESKQDYFDNCILTAPEKQDANVENKENINKENSGQSNACPACIISCKLLEKVKDIEQTDLQFVPDFFDAEFNPKFPSNNPQVVGKWKTASELSGLLQAHSLQNPFETCNLVPLENLEVYMGESGSDYTSSLDTSQQNWESRKTHDPAYTFSSIMRELNALLHCDTSQFIPEVKPVSDLPNKPTERPESTSNPSTLGNRLLAKADLGDFNRFTVVLSSNFDVYTGESRSQETASESNASYLDSVSEPQNSLSSDHVRDKIAPHFWCSNAFTDFIPSYLNPLFPLTNRENIEGSEKQFVPNNGDKAENSKSEQPMNQPPTNDGTDSHNQALPGPNLEIYKGESESTGEDPGSRTSHCEKSISNDAPGLANYLLGTGISSLEEDVPFICDDFKDFEPSAAGTGSIAMDSELDSQTTLYEAVLLPGLNAAEWADRVVQHTRIPVHDNFWLTNDPYHEEISQGASDLEDKSETLVSENREYIVKGPIKDETQNISDVGEGPNKRLPGSSSDLASSVNNPGKLPEGVVQRHAAELAGILTTILGAPPNDECDLTMLNQHIPTGSLSPKSSPNNIYTGTKKRAAEIAEDLLEFTDVTFDNDASLIANCVELSDTYCCPENIPKDPNCVTDLAFIPVSAAEIAARIDSLLGCFTLEDDHLVKSDSTKDSNSKHKTDQSDALPKSKDSLGILKPTAPPRRSQHCASDIAGMLIDKGIAVFDGDTQLIPQVQKPVGYCKFDRNYTFAIQLEKPIRGWVRDQFSNDFRKTNPNKPGPNSINRIPTSENHAEQGYKSYDRPLTPSQVKTVRIRQRKFANQEDVSEIGSSNYSKTEKLVKYYTTREVELESGFRNNDCTVRFQRSQSLNKGYRLPQARSPENINISFERSNSLPPSRSFRTTPEQRSLKRMNDFECLPHLQPECKTKTPELLHIYTPESIVTVRTALELQQYREYQERKLNMESEPSYNYRKFLRSQLPVEGPLPYKVYTDDEDSEKSTVSSRSGYIISVKRQ